MRFFGPVHTPESVADQLVRGLEDGSITLDGKPEEEQRAGARSERPCDLPEPGSQSAAGGATAKVTDCKVPAMPRRD
jgi:hypothetical protein